MNLSMPTRIAIDCGLEHLADQEADRQRNGRDRLEIDQRLQPDPANALEITHRGDAVHHGAEDHRRDQHPDQRDEAVAERLQRLAEIGVEITDEDSERDRDQHLDIEDPAGDDDWLNRNLCHNVGPGNASSVHDVHRVMASAEATITFFSDRTNIDRGAVTPGKMMIPTGSDQEAQSDFPSCIRSWPRRWSGAQNETQ
jgi:hypothetical protein